MKQFIATLIFYTTLLSSTAQSRQNVAPSANEICPIKVGSTVPPLKLHAVKGDIFDLNAILAQKPTLLIFYRGGWCPFCNRQLSQIRKIHPQLLALGYQVIAISADKPEKLAETMQRDSLDYMLLSDSKTTAAQAFGLAFRVEENVVKRYKRGKMDLEDASGETHHILPVPAAFVVGTDGTISFSYVNPNYKVRVDPDVLLTAAKSALTDKSTKP